MDLPVSDNDELKGGGNTISQISCQDAESAEHRDKRMALTNEAYIAPGKQVASEHSTKHSSPSSLSHDYPHRLLCCTEGQASAISSLEQPRIIASEALQESACQGSSRVPSMFNVAQNRAEINTYFTRLKKVRESKPEVKSTYWIVSCNFCGKSMQSNPTTMENHFCGKRSEICLRASDAVRQNAERMRAERREENKRRWTNKSQPDNDGEMINVNIACYGAQAREISGEQQQVGQSNITLSKEVRRLHKKVSGGSLASDENASSQSTGGKVGTQDITKLEAELAHLKEKLRSHEEQYRQDKEQHRKDKEEHDKKLSQLERRMASLNIFNISSLQNASTTLCSTFEEHDAAGGQINESNHPDPEVWVNLFENEDYQ